MDNKLNNLLLKERRQLTPTLFFRNETPIPISFLHNQNQFSGSVLYRFLCLPFGGFSRTFPIFIFIWPAASTHLFSPCFSFQLTIFHIGFHNFAAFQFSVSLRQHSLLFRTLSSGFQWRPVFIYFCLIIISYTCRFFVNEPSPSWINGI